MVLDEWFPLNNTSVFPSPRSCSIMLCCYGMPCHVILYYMNAISCYVMLCYVMLCYVITPPHSRALGRFIGSTTASCVFLCVVYMLVVCVIVRLDCLNTAPSHSRTMVQHGQHVSLSLYMYIYIYIYIHEHIYIYIYIYTCMIQVYT